MGKVKALVILGLCGLSSLSAADFGLVKVSVGSFREEPRHAAEMATQAIMGTPVEILEKSSNGEWLKVMLPDSVVAWGDRKSIEKIDSVDMDMWRTSPRYIVTSLDVVPVKDENGRRISELVNGAIVENLPVAEGARGSVSVLLPDGREGLVDAKAVEIFDRWARKPYDVERLVEVATSMVGVPYLWGGTSTKMNDCSGFTRVCYSDAGRFLLPRNSSWQASIDEQIPADRAFEKGDLLFFKNPDTGRVMHVAISLGGNDFIHSSGQVHFGRLLGNGMTDDGHTFSHGVRPVRDDGTLAPGVIRYIDHPWYFNKQ